MPPPPSLAYVWSTGLGVPRPGRSRPPYPPVHQLLVLGHPVGLQRPLQGGPPRERRLHQRGLGAAAVHRHQVEPDRQLSAPVDGLGDLQAGMPQALDRALRLLNARSLGCSV